MTVAVFNAKAPAICRRLMADFPTLSKFDTFAILGNLGHESGGLTAFQETNPTVAGSAGGWGWAQWTGMKPPSGRRYLFNEWCRKQGITDLKSDSANYGFLAHELRTTYKSAIAKVKAADSLYDKVVAFELAYERAGVKHYDSRFTWAKRAQTAYEAAPGSQPLPTPKPEPVPAPKPTPAPKPPAPVKEGLGVTVAAVIAAVISFGVKALAVVGALVVIGGIGYLIYRSRKSQ